MRLFRLLAIVFAAVTAFSVVSAAATSVGTTSRPIQANGLLVSHCSTGSLSFSYTQTGSGNTAVIDHVTVSGIDSNCNGGSLQTELVNGSGASIGHAAATVAAGTTGSMAVSPQPTTVNVAGIRLVISGP